MAGSSRQRGAAAGNSSKHDWYCCKGCVNYKGEKWWNWGSADKCTKCKLHKRASFGGNRIIGDPSKHVPTAGENKLKAELKKLEKKLQEALAKNGDGGSSNGMDIEGEDAGVAAPAGAAERKRVDWLAAEIKFLKGRAEGGSHYDDAINKFQQEMDQLKQQLHDAKPLDAKVLAARREVRRMESSLTKQDEKVEAQRQKLEAAKKEFEESKAQQAKATAELAASRSRLQGLLAADVAGGPAGVAPKAEAQAPQQALDEPALVRELEKQGMDNTQSQSVAKMLSGLIPALMVSKARDENSSMEPGPARAPDPLADASEEQLRASLEQLWPGEMAPHIPQDIEGLRAAARRAAQCPLIRAAAKASPY